MNNNLLDLFSQQFDKTEKQNEPDYGYMDYITAKLSYLEYHKTDFVDNDWFRDTIWQPSKMKAIMDKPNEPVIDDTDYSTMPLGLRGAQQRNGIHDHGLELIDDNTDHGQEKLFSATPMLDKALPQAEPSNELIGNKKPVKAPKKGRQLAERTHDMNTLTKAEFFGKFRSAIRKIWLYSAIRREAVKRAKKNTNAYLCHDCKQLFTTKEIEVDHIVPAGSLRDYEDFSPFIERMFNVDADGLVVLCKPCHKIKTDEHRNNNN